MDTYEAYLVANAAQISSIEGVLRTLAYILPGKGEKWDKESWMQS